FVDTETTGLDPRWHQVWEVAAIVERTEHVWQLPVDLSRADPRALDVGRFHQRRAAGHLTPQRSFAADFARLTWGSHLVGASVSFDAERLARLLWANGACPGWHHRLIDVECYAAGHLGLAVPLGLVATADRLGIDRTTHEAHTALGDARLARDVYQGD
ncbi:MAG: exonuclease domain-containing protein, partial [Acidimicrobiales bacterium]